MDNSEEDKPKFLCKEGFGVTQCPLEKEKLKGPCKHEKQCESVKKEASASEKKG